jgi:hypothetical protein
MRVLIALVVWVAAAGGAFGISQVVADSIHSTASASAGAGAGPSTGAGQSTFGSRSAVPNVPSGGGGTSIDPTKVKSTDAVSLFRAANLARALAVARAQLGAGAKLDNVALYPGYLSLTAVKGGGEVEFYLNVAGTHNTTNTGGSPGSDQLFPLAQLGAGVPAALAQRIATAGHVPESKLNYMVVQGDPVSHQAHWLVYPVHGTRAEYFEAAGATGSLFELRANSQTGLQRIRG